MTQKFKIFLYVLITFCFVFSKSLSEDFFFEGTEIEILNNGEKLRSNKGVKITSSNDIIITAEEFEYDKKKNELLLNGSVLFEDKANQTIIKTQKIKYIKKIEKIISYNLTELEIENKIFLKTKDLIYFKNSNEIKSSFYTKIEDNFGNKFITDEFVFNIQEKTLKGMNVKLQDKNGNISNFESFFGDISKDEFYGKNVKINFSDRSFGNSENQPRLYGNSFSSDTSSSKISKGIFTTCKKRDGCPPWVITAEEVEHDKEKKIINYRNAWLEVYDKPILYFPKFFHPDPSVKRQSGFLIPQFNDSGNSGTSVQIPYYKVLAKNKDLTFSPTLFSDKNFILQNEYRQVEKNYDHVSDFGFFTSAFNSGSQETKSHIFSKTNIFLESEFFDLSELEVNLEQVSNDTYLKKYKVNSPLIESEVLMHSFIKYEGYSENDTLSVSAETYEDLSKKNNDRYEIILPNIKYSKNLSNSLDILGDLDFTSSFFQKQFETNNYSRDLDNSLTYLSPKIFSEAGFVNDYKFKLKNTNSHSESGTDKSESKTKLLSQLMYSISFPLKKQTEVYESFITPKLSYRFSPNKTKNIKNSDNKLDISNINSFNRISESDVVESGHSITAGFGYKKNDLNGNQKISFDVAQVISDQNNPDLPIKSTLNKKYSDVIGNLQLNLNEILSLDYDFMLDDGLKKSNYNSIKTTLNFNNLVTSFEFLEEGDIVGKNHFYGNETTLKLNNNNSLAFSTRSNREIDMTEFYNLIYQYENDCLKAALEYNKRFYTDDDIKPEEELLFSLTIIPFSKFNSTNLK